MIGKPKGQKPRPKQDNKEQSARFKETARELGADENPEKFEEAFKKIIAPKVRDV